MRITSAAAATTPPARTDDHPQLGALIYSHRPSRVGTTWWSLAVVLSMFLGAMFVYFPIFHLPQPLSTSALNPLVISGLIWMVTTFVLGFVYIRRRIVTTLHEYRGGFVLRIGNRQTSGRWSDIHTVQARSVTGMPPCLDVTMSDGNVLTVRTYLFPDHRVILALFKPAPASQPPPAPPA